MSAVQFADRLRTGALEHAAVDFEKMHAIAKHLHETPGAVDEFCKDPEGYAFRFNGYAVQEGHHLHVADAENNLLPAEKYGVFGSEDRPMWGRSEIRVGYKTTALVECV